MLQHMQSTFIFESVRPSIVWDSDAHEKVMQKVISRCHAIATRRESLWPFSGSHLTTNSRLWGGHFILVPIVAGCGFQCWVWAGNHFWLGKSNVLNMQMSDVRHLAETLENRLSAVLSLTAGHVFDLKSRTWNDDPQTNIGEGLRRAKTFIICTHLPACMLSKYC
jgi:hypothetical protein